MQIENAEGVMVDVFTPEEVAAQIATAVAVKETEFGTVKTGLEEKLTEAEKRAVERNGEFAKFRELNEKQLAELSAKDLIIYNNQKALADANLKNEESGKKTHDAAVDATIRAKVGNDPKLFEKAKAMYSIIGLEDLTPEQMQVRVTAAVGALVQTEPDLMASISVGLNGSYQPPVKVETSESFADTERGKAAAKELGLNIELPK